MGVRLPAEAYVVAGVNVFAGVKTGVENVEPLRGSIDEVGTTWAFVLLLVNSNAANVSRTNIVVLVVVVRGNIVAGLDGIHSTCND